MFKPSAIPPIEAVLMARRGRANLSGAEMQLAALSVMQFVYGVPAWT